MREYTEVNKNAYDQVADDYNRRWKSYLKDQTKVLDPFESHLRKTFSDPIHILDAGCGVGLDAHILTSHGFSVTGIDVSSKMAAYARQNAPQARILEDDFLSFEANQRFHGIVMTAFIHQFPKTDIPQVLNKVSSLLVPSGYGLICTTRSERPKEGYFAKAEHGFRVKRFRKFWTPDELRETMAAHSFDIVELFEDKDSLFEKTWMNLVFQLK